MTRFLHVLGVALWVGGAIALLLLDQQSRRTPREALADAVQLQATLLRAMVLPGAVLVVITGLLLTLRLYGSATSLSGFPVPLMVMQAAGLVGAVLVLVVMAPALTRLTRLEPAGPHARLFDQLRGRVRAVGFIALGFAVAALVAATR